jgi:hypothetical protein
MTRRTVRLTDRLNAEIENAAKERGFESPTAFMRTAAEMALRDNREVALGEAEQRLSATLERLAREIRNVRRAQEAEFSFLDSLVKMLLTCIPEPSGDAYSQAIARGKFRYERFLKSVGAGMAGDSGAAIGELTSRVE